MRIASFFGLVCLSIFLSSCFVRTNRVIFKTTVPVISQHTDFNKDSLRCTFLVDASPRTVVIPFFIFKTDKKKFRVAYQLHGKGISGREYTCSFKRLVLKNDTQVVARSKDLQLFKEEKDGRFAEDGISPFYSCGYLVILPDAKKMNLKLEMEMDVHSKNNIEEDMLFTVPLQKIEEKDLKLLKITQ